MKKVTMWRILGLDGVWFEQKLHAEIKARAIFPVEEADQHAARISSRVFYTEVAD